jgi:hypothetical protein
MDVYQRRRLVALGVVVVVIGLIVAIASAGGGGSDSTPVSTTTTEAASKDSFIASADGICAETATAVANLSSDDVAQQAKQELDFTKSQLSQIKALPQPTQDKAKLDAFYTALKDQIESLTKKVDAANSGDSAELASVDTQLASAEANVRAAAQSYGMKQCGEEGKPSSSGGGGGASGGTPPPVTTTTPVAPAPTTTTPPATTPPATTPPPGSGGSGGGTGGAGGGSGGIGSG